MRIVFMGSSDASAVTLRALLRAPQVNVVGVVTQPDRPSGRRQRFTPCPCKAFAVEKHVSPIISPEKVNAPEVLEQLEQLKPDVIIVVAFGQFLGRRLLALPPHGCINGHFSLLPKYRGAAPINWAIYHGEDETGVSVIHMTPRVDAGPVIAQERTPIEDGETAEQLEARLAEIGSRLVHRVIDALESGEPESLPQNPALASRAPRLKKTDGLIDWTRSAEAVRNHIRAFIPWPRSYTFWRRAGSTPLRMIVGPVEIGGDSPPRVQPGTVVEGDGNRVVVATGAGCVALRSLQPAGKRELDIREFQLGYRLEPGDRFGPEA